MSTNRIDNLAAKAVSKAATLEHTDGDGRTDGQERATDCMDPLDPTSTSPGGGPLPPGAVSSPLHLVADKADADVLLSWSTTDASTRTFRVRRSESKLGPFDPHPDGMDVSGTLLTDASLLGDGRSYFYVVSALNCAGVEGP